MSLLLESVLAVQPDAPDRFIGGSLRSALPRLFGGHISAQMISAAGRTVEPGLAVNSAHMCFLRPGLMGRQVVYQVERVRDTSSFSTRRVTARQARAVIATATVSMHRPEDGPRWGTPMPGVLPPEDIAAGHAPIQLERRWRREWPDWDIRLIPSTDEPDGNSSDRSSVRVWMRHGGRMPDDLGDHAALAYASDMTLGLTSLASRSLPLADHGMFLSSLDHAIWFHAAFRSDEWLLHDQVAVVSANARTLCKGHVYSEDGRHVATVMQETLVRKRG